MPDRYLIANWKMNLPPEGLAAYLDAVEELRGDGTTVVVAPPFPYLREISARATVAVAAQNCGDQPQGAFTGEVSTKMLLDAGARYVIIGHSERRNVYGETDAMIARKLALAIESGLTPVLCIGEDLRVREAGHAPRFLADQVKAVAIPALETAKQVVIAYEPVWAIGTGRNASAAMCAETCDEVRGALQRFWPARYATEAPVLYGGSVTPDNVDELVRDGAIDGFLVGGASLDSGKFGAIHRALAQRT